MLARATQVKSLSVKSAEPRALPWLAAHPVPKKKTMPPRSARLLDLLRAKGDILTSISASEAESCLLESLQLARRSGLLALELRAGISLARFWAGRARHVKALELLDPIFNRFSEGFQTRDLVAAANLLQQLRSYPA